jgi:hypothetical protein
MSEKEKESWNRFLTPAREEELESLYTEVTGKTNPMEGSEEKPFFLRAAESRAQSSGMSTNQLLAVYSERLRNSKYPTPECLTPDEIQEWVLGVLLSSERQQHLDTCEGCRNLLGAAEPTEPVVVELMEEVRLMAACFSGQARAAVASFGNARSRSNLLRAASLFLK